MTEGDIGRLAQRMVDEHAGDAEAECLARAFYYRALQDFTTEAHWKRVAEAVRGLAVMLGKCRFTIFVTRTAGTFENYLTARVFQNQHFPEVQTC